MPCKLENKVSAANGVFSFSLGTSMANRIGFVVLDIVSGILLLLNKVMFLRFSNHPIKKVANTSHPPINIIVNNVSVAIDLIIKYFSQQPKHM